MIESIRLSANAESCFKTRIWKELHSGVAYLRRHDNQHNDTQHNGIQHNDKRHNGRVLLC
jgi:hypothetical protein